MFANHFMTIAPHAAVMVSSKDFGSRSPTTASTNSGQNAKKLRRARSERTNTKNDKKTQLPEIRIASRQSC
ncbi:hypothetical protein PR003_g12002 [Phytophthora rubi]|uniref:Uncharacterized protein n=1 Tax=Phytophthora rubi TaxID=129364 RepID=A0A6A3LYQ3_9STRA|nr:hypothetical protein PR002_g11461 [Phytophthora rubi]KAE9030327.1 hypothetical protein PR001_g11285 [Phytophthora rubi]KAE9337462.1 hypothetical protein PR003_g12002 [Phytophthora rubi]